MFYKVEDFLAEWGSEAGGTQKVLEALTDESLDRRLIPEYRTLGQLAWHLVGTYGEMLPQTGLAFSAPTEHDPVPSTVKGISDAYRAVGAAMAEAVKNQWNDGTLLESRNMYGEEWKNGATLRVLIQHEVHHRAQMTVLMRLAGLRVPGVYGPAKEEWAAFGAEPPAL